MDYNELKKALKKELGLIFRKFGFKGSGTNYSRISDSRVDTIVVQFYSGGHKFCINLGLNFPEVLPISQRLVNTSEYEPEIRKRLTRSNDPTDQWWLLESIEDVVSAVNSIEPRLRDQGQDFFRLYQNPEEILGRLASELLINKSIPIEFKDYGLSTVVRTIFMLAVFHYRKGKYNVSDGLSSLALSLITGQTGSGLIDHFKAIERRSFV